MMEAAIMAIPERDSRSARIEERHWDLWGQMARSRYASAPGWYSEQCWATEGNWRDHEADTWSVPPEDEDTAERIGRAVARLPVYERKAITAWHRAFPRAPAQAHICALSLKVDPSWMADNWRRIQIKVEACIGG